MKYIMDFIYLLAGLGFSPVMIYRRVRFGRYRAGWNQRFGHIVRRSPDNKCIWIHAVSVGEVNATRTIVDELTNKFGDHEILITTTTDTGFARANAIYGFRLQVCYFPLDLSWIIGRAFATIKPSICILMELEVWPNFAQQAAALNIPIIVANGRVTERSMRRYSLVKPFAKKMFANVTCILAQTEQYAERFRRLGCDADKVVVTGSLKYDTARITDKVDGADALAEQLFGKFSIQNSQFKIPLWVAGGTGTDEEAIILDIYKKLRQNDEFRDVRLAIVPRKPERFDEVAVLIKKNGFELLRYSEVINNKSNSKLDSVILGDTMGDLRKFYSLATVVFVGRSLVPMGGSDMMESAALGKCTVFGPHAFNFEQTVTALLADDGAILVNNAEELLTALYKCLIDKDYAEQISANGRKVIEQNQGATKKTVAKISEMLKNASQIAV